MWYIRLNPAGAGREYPAPGGQLEHVLLNHANRPQGARQRHPAGGILHNHSSSPTDQRHALHVKCYATRCLKSVGRSVGRSLSSDVSVRNLVCFSNFLEPILWIYRPGYCSRHRFYTNSIAYINSNTFFIPASLPPDPLLTPSTFAFISNLTSNYNEATTGPTDTSHSLSSFIPIPTQPTPIFH